MPCGERQQVRHPVVEGGPVCPLRFDAWGSGRGAVPVVQCGAVQCDEVQCGAVRRGAVRCGAARCGAAWCGAVCDIRGYSTLSPVEGGSSSTTAGVHAAPSGAETARVRLSEGSPVTVRF